MSSDSGEKNDWGVWLASTALVVILLTVLFGGMIWQWMAARPRAAGSAGNVAHVQTLMQPIQFSDERAMRATVDTLPGRSLSEAMVLLRLPVTGVIAYVDSTACYNIVVLSPDKGLLKVTTDHGEVIGAVFEKE